MKVILAGASGFIGGALIKRFAGWEIVVLSRSGRAVRGASRTVVWDGKSLGKWSEEFEGAEAVINLSGESLVQRWNTEGKRRIVESRTLSTAVIAQAIAECKNPPKAWVNGSAVGIYGDTGDRLVGESAPPGIGFLAETCVAWEAAMEKATIQTRRVIVRIGIVIGKDGGFLATLSKLTRAFLGGSVGNGKQYLPWIHLDDLAEIFYWASTGEIQGVVNGVQPIPVTNADFMTALRKALHRPWSPPAPAFGLKVVELVAGIPAELALISSRVTTEVLPANGFVFRHRDLDEAILASL